MTENRTLCCWPHSLRCSPCLLRPPHAANRMPIGFFDDMLVPILRRRATQNLAGRSRDRRLGHPHDRQLGDDCVDQARRTLRTATTPPTALGDLDDLVFQSGLYGMRVMIDITGTPKWANGNKTPNTMPKKLSDLTTFAKMLATRYDGRTRARLVGALVGLERAEPPALPDAAVRRARRSSARRTTRSSTRPRTPASRPATRWRRSRSARRRRVGATSRSPGAAQSSPRARSRGCSRR